MHLQRRERLRRGGPSRPRQTLFPMKNRPNSSNRAPRQQPLDHLRPGGRSRDERAAGQAAATTDEPRTEGAGWKGIEDAEDGQPAEPSTPGGGNADALRGKATRSPAATATRPHLEGSEQGPS